MEFKTSKYIVVTPTVDHENHIIYSTRTSKTFIINAKNLKSLQDASYDLIPPETMVRLLDAEIIVPQMEDELEHILTDYEANSESSYEFGLTIQPSGNCQLGCHYCGQKHAKFEMSDETFRNTVAHLNKKLDEKPYKSLTVTWYGAEPLMSLNNIHRLSLEFFKICKERNLRYSALMITNGLSLKPKIFEVLARDYKVTKYQITLDGSAEFHDKSRITKGGVPTFDIIYKNIEECVRSDAYRETGSKFLIRCNVTKENSNGINGLFKKMANDNIHDKVGIELAPVHDWGGNNASQKGFTREEFAGLEIEWLLLMKDLGFKIPSLIPGRRYNTCMVTSGDSAELIDASGNITYCWETTYTPQYEDSDYIVGNVNKPQPYFPHKDTAPLKNWYSMIRNGESWCKGCTFLPVCGGACPISWAKKEAPCPSFKYNMHEKLVMEYFINRNIEI